MKRFNTSSDNPLLATVRHNRMVARFVAGAVIVAWILAVLVSTAWQQSSLSVKPPIDAAADHSVAESSTDGVRDAQPRLDPGEVMFPSSNVQG